ncbi:probable methyltransferase-like protein 24 isoform X2 [Littorina saxatilis]|uniref:probable methyltransferase-like protein 24 isoform X2 n=1 Tax=Littorina saxatilis TaxID=31220 RepID=UPI0038B5477A
MTGQRNYRVLTLAVAFIAGCVVVVLYLPAVREKLTKVQEQIQPPILQEQISQSAQDQGDASKDTLPLTKAQKQIQPPMIQSAQGDVYKAEQDATRSRSPVTLPKVKDTLPVANFDDNWKKWKEDISLTNLRNYGLVENIPGEATLNTYSAERLSAIYHSYLDNNDIICHRKLRMGNVGDGGWEICDDYEWRPVQPCIIYSFGINNDFSFDDESGAIYGCDVYAFDPSMKAKTYKRSDRVMFYSVGIGGKSGDPETNKKGWVLHSFSNIRQMLNHTKVIDVVKMDVESAEWPSLATMVKEQQLDNVRQLLVEFHEMSDATSRLLAHLILFHDLERIGLRKFYVSKNVYGHRKAAAVPILRTSSYEIHFVNDNFRRSPF